MLLASGVTQTRFAISARRSNPTVSDSDLGTGILRNSDIGENYKVRIAEISREIALFPSEINPNKKTISEKNLSIMVGDFSSETMEHIMREGQSHLFIHNSDGPGISFGPLVIPGKTPCIRCIELSIEERTGMRFETVLGSKISVKLSTLELSSHRFPTPIASLSQAQHCPSKNSPHSNLGAQNETISIYHREMRTCFSK